MKKDLKMIKSLFFTAVSFIIVMTGAVYSQDMDVPANLQAALFKKIFSFNFAKVLKLGSNA